MQCILISIYLFQLRFRLKYPRKLKQKKLESFKEHMLETIWEENITISRKAFYDRFGSPKMVADNYYKMRTPAEARQYRKELTFKVLFFISILVVLIGLILICRLPKPTLDIPPKKAEKVAALLVQRLIS